MFLQSLSDIVNRLQVIESKIDKLGQVMKYNTPSTSQQHDSLGAGPSQLGNNGVNSIWWIEKEIILMT